MQYLYLSWAFSITFADSAILIDLTSFVPAVIIELYKLFITLTVKICSTQKSTLLYPFN